MPTALIIGAGIAGPAVAMALQKAGVDSVVYEAYPTGADDAGAFLTVAANGLDALRAIDAHQLITDNAFPATSVELLSASGKRLGELRLDGHSGGRLGPRTLKRARLYRLLRDEAVARGITIQYGKRLADATTSPAGSVVASFTDGTRTTGDLLIGADGIHSVTRTLIDPTAPRPRYTGQNTVCGYTRAPVDAAADSYRMIYGKRAFFGYTTAPDGETWWFANVPGTELPRPAATTPEQWRRRLVALFARDNSPAAQIVAATDDIVGSNAYDIPSTPRWYDRSMVIVGDAAHATAPNAAQGASMALEDAVVLACCLRDLPNTRDAFAAYDQLRRERVERVVAISARMASTKMPGAVKRLLRNVITPRKLTKRRPSSSDWLHQHHIDWDAPVRLADS